MKKLKTIVLSGLLTLTLYGEQEIHHNHIGSSNFKINYGKFDFENSKKKDNGKSHAVEFDHQDNKHHYRLYYEKSTIKTMPIVPKDLEVKKYALKYGYALNKKSKLSFTYLTIDDNLMKETNGGHIYGVGYTYKALQAIQYFSDYKHFDVYQSDLKFGFKKSFSNWELMVRVLGKYIYLDNKNSNSFSRKANRDYFTTGLKLHAHNKSYHLSAGTYLGKRMFAVMNEGLKVQHHAMEFKRSYLFALGKEFENMDIYLRYAQHKADEININSFNVTRKNIEVELSYKF